MTQITCIHCRNKLHVEPTDALWLTCPRCLAKIMNPEAAGEPPIDYVDVSRPDRDARVDSAGTVICLLVFSVLILLGVGLFFFSGGHQLVSASEEGIYIVAIGAVSLTTIVVGTVVLVVLSNNPVAKPLTVVLGMIGVALTGLVVIGLLVSCAITTAIISFFRACGCK